MKVGVFSKHSKNFFSNGCNQQALFVYETLDCIDSINCTIITMEPDKIDNVRTVSVTENIKNLLKFKVIIFLSNAIVQEHILKQLKEANIILIEYNCGNYYYIFQEDIIFNTHKKIKNIDYYKYYDEYWSIPNYKKDKYFYETVYKTDFKTAPYVWNTTIIDKYANINYDINVAQSQTKYILIAEPNVQITKTCLIPLLICERLYNNNIFKNIKVIVLSQKKNEAFKKFLEMLNIYRDKRVETYDRPVFFNIIKQFKEKKIDFYVLSHHQDNPLNFLHLETLYLGYPLIHNCGCYKKAGYFYKDIKQGSEKLFEAINNHKNIIEDYNKESEKVLFKYSPNNPNNINNYKILLENITSKEIYKGMSLIDNIIVSPTQGFGNRIRFLNTVYQIAKYFNKKLYILWQDEECCHVNLEDIISDIPGVEILKVAINSLDYLYHGHKHLKDIINHVPDRKYDYLLLTGGHEFKLDEIDQNSFIKNKAIFYKSIIWSDTVNNLVSGYKNKYNLDKYVAVHYRGYSEKYDSGDIKKNSEGDFEVMNKIEKYNELVNKVKQEYKIVLLSNITDHNLNNNRLINISNKNMDRSSSDDMVTSIAEFIILSQSNLIIGSCNSSFSDEASFFNMSPKLMPIESKKNIAYHCYGLSLNDNIFSLNYNQAVISTILNN